VFQFATNVGLNQRLFAVILLFCQLQSFVPQVWTCKCRTTESACSMTCTCAQAKSPPCTRSCHNHCVKEGQYLQAQQLAQAGTTPNCQCEERPSSDTLKPANYLEVIGGEFFALSAHLIVAIDLPQEVLCDRGDYVSTAHSRDLFVSFCRLTI
jgi:hypothetical protein